MANCLVWPSIALPTADEQTLQTHLIRECLDRCAYLSPPAHSPTPFLAYALDLGELLAKRAVPLAGDSVGWIGVHFKPKSGLHQHGLIGDDLYAGRAGIALFLAGLYRVTGEARWRDLTLAGLRSGVTGDGWGPEGRIYALTQIAHLLDAPEVLDAPLPGEGDLSAWGILDGVAGLLLELLACRQRTTDQRRRARLLGSAVACGERLLADEADWQHPTRGLGGFSHGAAGIAYALARLHAASGAARFREGAARGWAFQYTLFDGKAGNWQDRRGETPVYLDNWCNGAAGIGLAAAGSLSLLSELVNPGRNPVTVTAREKAAGFLSWYVRPTELADVVERAGVLLTDGPPPFLDTLCCGGFGQIDCLLEMGLLLGRTAWVERATAQAREVLARASAAGHFCLYDDLPAHIFNPAFYRGVAGIGYSLLRLAAVSGEMDARLPCVLNYSV